MDFANDFTDLAQRLRRHVQVLAAAPRTPGSPQHTRTRRYLHETLSDAGWTTRDVAYAAVQGVACTNVFAEPAAVFGQMQPALPLVIVGAHYDSVPDSPGADDNASAVAALLELGRLLAPHIAAPAARLQLVAYDLEEYGLVGSACHSQDLKKTGAQVKGMIALEMLGFVDHRPGSQRLPPLLVGKYPDVGNFIGIVGNEASRSVLEAVTAGMKSVPGLPVEVLAVPDTGHILRETRLSDHSSFWDQGFPALMITDTSFMRNPHYHQVSDTPATLDYDFLARVTAGVCTGVMNLLHGA